jgi:beta-N-acetylhexosaminidase
MSLRDIRRHAGQLAIVGFDGHQVPAELRSMARELDLGGVVLLSRNIAEPEQVSELSRECQTLAADMPLWVSVDQEGGRVARLKRPFTEWPPMITLGRARDERLADRFARALAAELKAVGISLDYAPVLDLHTEAGKTAIGDRALADRAEDAARLGRIIIRALQSEGVAACGKHFPGIGDAAGDPHDELPILEHPPDRFDAVELVPFEAAIDADVAAIMPAHVLIPALDDKNPASFSSAIVKDLLKDKLGFGGLVLTDDLSMGALAGFSIPDAAVAAVGAGCDAVLIGTADLDQQVAALEAIIYAVEQKRLPERRVDDALARHRRVKERFLALPRQHPARAPLRAVLGSDEHQSIADEMARFA